MAATFNVVSLFPRLRRIGRMPTENEMAAYWEACRLQRIQAAVLACEFAYSHRESSTHSDGRKRQRMHPANTGRYGSSVLGCRLGLSEEDRFVITTGANFKLRPGEGQLVQFHPKHDYKMCSEPEAVIAAKSYPVKCIRIYGLTLFSDNMQEEDVSKLFCNIQHPCADCREFLIEFLRPEAPVTLVRHLLPCDNSAAEIVYDHLGRPCITEEWTFGQICEHHRILVGRRSAKT